jgi:hypothetical protein
MKTGSILVLFALVISVIIPNITIVGAAAGDRPVILTLDVCSQSGSATTSNADAPSIHECICSPAPLPLLSSYTELNPLFNPFVTAFQEERPPRV